MIEQDIQTVLNCLWAMTGEVDPERFAIGVDMKSWWELAKGEKDVLELTMTVGSKVYFIIPLGDVPEGTVALVWRKPE